MPSIYDSITIAKKDNRNLLAILLDPDKIQWESLDSMINKIKRSPATHILVGGSLVVSNNMNRLILAMRACDLPIVIFPGDPSQISPLADGILLLSLISGRNPDLLIGHHVDAAMRLRKSELEVIPTGYILIDGGNETAVNRISRTSPIKSSDTAQIEATAVAAELLGHKLIYLEAGSGADFRVPDAVISGVKTNIEIPLIVGGGITTHRQIQQAYDAGATMVVIGTAFENNFDFFDGL